MSRRRRPRRVAVFRKYFRTRIRFAMLRPSLHFHCKNYAEDKTEHHVSTLIPYFLGYDEAHCLGCLQLSFFAGCVLKIAGPHISPALYRVSVFVSGVIYLTRVFESLSGLRGNPYRLRIARRDATCFNKNYD